MPTKSSSKIITSFLFVLMCAVIVWVHFLYSSVITDNQGFKYTVREGSSIRNVIDDLSAQNVIQHPRLFRFLVYLKGASHKLKAGEYFFARGTGSLKLLNQLITGTGVVQYAFTIVPGWNFQDIRNALLAEAHLNHTIQTLSDAELMKELGNPNQKPEGLFYPDTYYFPNGGADKIILKHAFKAMQEKLNLAWQTHDATLPFKNPYEALIAASIIEKEAYKKDELPKIAGVLVNRLKRNMLLQFDPTVIYGMGSHYTGTIHRSDLLEDTPFNTYVHRGLPPTPISMPSLRAIQAIMHPEQHDLYYFVAHPDGSHKFSKELLEHYKAVEVARSLPRWYFNYSVARRYLLKLFSEEVAEPQSGLLVIPAKVGIHSDKIS